MTRLSALRMPFQLTSLLFVGLSSLFLSLALSVDGAARWIAAIAVFLLVSWLNKYAFAILEQAANGVWESPVASIEMLGPFGGVRPWIHPLLAALIVIAAMPLSNAARSAIAVLAIALLPASVCALVLSPRLMDAVNPVGLWRTIRGLGIDYLLLLLGIAVALALALLVERLPIWPVLRFGSWELLALCVYAQMGGAIHRRRLELGFQPRVSPERRAERDLREHQRQRQQMIDAVYGAVRARDFARTTRPLHEWLKSADKTWLASDVPVVLSQASLWPEQRGLRAVALTLVSHLMAINDLSLALTVAESTLKQLPAFALETETATVVLARYAFHSGHRGIARTLLNNYAAASEGRPLGAELATLQRDVEYGENVQL